MKKRLLALVAAMVMVLSLVACGAPATVEEYYTQPEIKEALDSQIEQMKGSYTGVYSDLGYEVSGNTFTYWFQFADQIEDADAAAEQLEGSLTDEMLSGIVSDVESECGVTGITCEYIYYNADGSVIFQDSYTSAQ
ncbi:MAG: DUF4854 domain-containing protein [Lachnospiraceae bacterium]|nr:DUF4854 domain-containing protein [Lachnospiraceae bacterium]